MGKTRQAQDENNKTLVQVIKRFEETGHRYNKIFQEILIKTPPKKCVCTNVLI